MYYYYCLLHLSCHSVAVVFTLVQTKQLKINIHKRNNTKTQYKQYKTQQIQIHIAKTPAHYKTHTYTHPHVTKQGKTTTVQIHTK
jgi:hypothetical protein